MNATTPRQGDARPVPGWVAATAIAGTVLIALGAFWLSFTTLVDLAHRSGLARAWVWPIIVDGVIVVATVSVVTLAPHGPRATRYPWILLFACATVSVTANALHALVSTHVGIPSPLAAAVAAVPPLVLLAITHLTVELTRRTSTTGSEPARPAAATPRPSAKPVPTMTDPNSARRRRTPRAARAEADRLHATGWTNRRIATHLGVHPSTVGRWLHTAEDADASVAHPPDGIPTTARATASIGGPPTQAVSATSTAARKER